MNISVFLPGNEKPEKIEKLLSLISFRNEDIKLALTRYLVKGTNLTAVAALYEMDESNFRRALAKLEKVANVIEEIKEIDWPDYQVTRFKQVS